MKEAQRRAYKTAWERRKREKRFMQGLTARGTERKICYRRFPVTHCGPFAIMSVIEKAYHEFKAQTQQQKDQHGTTK